MSIDKAFNYREVSNSIATAGILLPEQLAELRAAGIEVIINLLPDASEYAVLGEKEIVEDQGIEYCYIPVDFASPRLAEYKKFKEILDRRNDKKILIHCAANYRVSAFYSLYAQETGLWSVGEAEKFVESIWNPADYPGWPEFLDEVREIGSGN